MALIYREFTAPNGKFYRCTYDGVRLLEIEHWRCASRRTGRYHWAHIWPKINDPGRTGVLPKGLPPALVAYVYFAAHSEQLLLRQERPKNQSRARRPKK